LSLLVPKRHAFATEVSPERTWLKVLRLGWFGRLLLLLLRLLLRISIERLLLGNLLWYLWWWYRSDHHLGFTRLTTFF
jgi:hypothetical protein